MSPSRKLNRKSNRFLASRATRRINSPPRWTFPDYLGQAIAACRRVIRARRRLMKLAPDRFDAAVVDRAERAAAESNAVQEEFRSAVARIYGVDESALPPRRVHEPRRRSARTETTIAREFGIAECWTVEALEALQQFRRHRPHEIPSLNRIAALLDLASRLGRLSAGLETNQRETPDSLEPAVSFREAIRRTYGDKRSSDPADLLK